MADPIANKWMLKSLADDVCETGSGPAPFPLIAEAKNSCELSPNVCYNGCNAFTMNSCIAECAGDGAAVAGVVSGTVLGQCEPKAHSASVKVNGHYCVREGDKFWMNNKNTEGYVLKLNALAATGAMVDDPMVTDEDWETACTIANTLDNCGGDHSKAYETLTKARQSSADPAYYNDPAVVNAQHFFKAYTMHKAYGVAGSMVQIFVYEELKTFNVLQGGQWLQNLADKIGAKSRSLLITGKPEQPHQVHYASPKSHKAAAWGMIGVLAARQKEKVAIAEKISNSPEARQALGRALVGQHVRSGGFYMGPPIM